MQLPRPIVQSRLPGLLALLGIQNTGTNPPYMGESVSPTFDFQTWYLRGQQEAVTNTQVLPASGTLNGFAMTNFTVPQGEWWYIENASLILNAQVGDSCTEVVIAQNIEVKTLFRSLPITIAASQGKTNRATDPFWAPPGSLIGLFLGIVVNASTAMSMSMQLLITRTKT